MYKTFDRYKIFFIFWIIAFFAFIRGYNAGWAYDAITFSYIIEGKSLRSLLQNMPDLTVRYLYQSTEYITYKLFGKQGWDWYLFKITLHTIFIYLFYNLCNIIFQKLLINKKYSVPLSLLVLLSPYSTEVVLYQVTLQYSISSILIIMSLLQINKFILYKKNIHLLIFFLLNYLSIFYSEFTFILPIFSFLFICIINKDVIKNAIVFCTISLSSIMFYMILSYYIQGDIVGHYGYNRHLVPRVNQIYYNFLIFLSDIFLYVQYWNFNKMFSFYEFLNNNFILIISIFIILILYIYYNVEYKIKYVLLILLLLIISISPVLNILFHTLTPIEADRYYYFSIGFAYLFAFTSTYYINKKILKFFIVFYLISNFIILQKNTNAWHNAQNLIDKSIQSFKPNEDKRYLFLAIADRINGALIFGSDESKENPFSISDFAMALSTKINMDLAGRIGQVLNYNVTSNNICPNIEIINDTTLKYTLPCCGHWWWKRRHGATDFENDYYKVKMIGGWQQEVLVTFKQKPKDMVYLYQCGEKFVTLDF
jgi:hypothetical protein